MEKVARYRGDVDKAAAPRYTCRKLAAGARLAPD